MAQEPWYPHRQPLQYNGPGNPITNPPDLNPPPWNRGGTLPGPNVVQQPVAWARRDNQMFASDGTNQVWTWESVIFDLRPGLAASYGSIPSAVAINHEAALGQSIYLCLIVGDDTTTGAIPIAGAAGVKAEYWEDGNNFTAANGELMRLTQVLDVTETLLAGGISTSQPVGASAFQFTPCVTSLRYWKVSFRLTIAGVIPVTERYFIQALLH